MISPAKAWTDRIEGLTKRELFAAMAMQALLSNPLIVEILMKCTEEEIRAGTLWPEKTSKSAKTMADALIAELNNQSRGEND